MIYTQLYTEIISRTIPNYSHLSENFLSEFPEIISDTWEYASVDISTPGDFCPHRNQSELGNRWSKAAHGFWKAPKTSLSRISENYI